MKITTTDIIKALPFEEKFKIELLRVIDFVTPDQKFAMEQTLWDTYFAIYALKRDENLELALERVKAGEEELDTHLYKRVEEKTQADMQKSMAEGAQKVDLSAARTAMEKIIQEIRASKKSPATKSN